MDEFSKSPFESEPGKLKLFIWKIWKIIWMTFPGFVTFYLVFFGTLN